MTVGTRSKFGQLISRTALGLVLAMGVVSAMPTEASAKAASRSKIEFSKAFQEAAADFDKTMSEAKSNAAVTAASEKVRTANTPEAKTAAAAEMDAALGGARGKLQTINAAVSTPGDKIKAGELNRNVGVLMNDTTLQHQGLVMMLDSGLVEQANLGQIQFLAGVTAYQSGNYQGAITYLRPALDGGYRDPQGLIQSVLADAYKRTNNTAAAADLVKQDLANAKAAGTRPSETSIRSALQAAYDAKQTTDAFDYATQLVEYYPTADSWKASLSVTRALSSLQAQDNLDLMRLMSRAGAMSTREDYLEYIENADPRRLPAETLKVIEAGVAAGKISASDSFVSEARQTANGRLAADRASLPESERSARAGSASAAIIMGTADAFLSYGQPAKAEELYTIALGKPGVDTARAQTRLGIAQFDQGKFAAAKESFAKVAAGPRQPLAKLWSVYAGQKAAPAPAAQPAS